MTGEMPSRAGRVSAAERRARIVAAARKLFVANGFHATGVAQIARESGVAIGQIYRDFTGKEDIVAVIVAADCATFIANDTLGAATDEAGVRAWLHHFIESDEDPDSRRLFAEIVAEAARNARIAEIIVGMRDEVHAALLHALTLLAPDQAFADRRLLLADLILTQSLGVMQHRLLVPDLAPGRLADATMALVLRELDRVGAVMAG